MIVIHRMRRPRLPFHGRASLCCSFEDLESTVGDRSLLWDAGGHGTLALDLRDKPLQILELMLERPGEIVTRKQIQQKLWPDTFVTYDYSLNTAVNKLRLALGDSAENPRFIETVARRGYRFIASVGMQSAPSSLTVISAPAVVASIAVLPFQNSSGQPEMEYLSDGLSEAVIRRVSQIPGVRVMARSTVLRYKGRELHPQAAARDLHVQSVLVGRVVPEEDVLNYDCRACRRRNRMGALGRRIQTAER